MPGYEVGPSLGAGSAGAVHRARRLVDGREVALKVLAAGAGPDGEARLRREHAVLAELDHPHVVRVLGLHAEAGVVAVAMELAPGGSLADLLRHRSRLEPAELVAIAAPVADALEAAHARGILHRDVKPANILFAADGRPLLSDFGVARSSHGPALTAPDVAALGTAEYLAPEVVDGAAHDAQADVYALGVVCYEALTGRRPYVGATPLAILRAADRGGAPGVRELAPEVPRDLAAAVEAALNRDPSARPASAAALATALRATASGGGAMSSQPAGSPPDSGTREFGPRPPAPPTEERRRVPWPAVAAAALVLLAAPVAVILATREEPPVPVPVPAPSPAPDPSPVVCATSNPPVPGPGEVLLEGDLLGDGCTSWALHRGAVLEVALVPGQEPTRFEIAEPGDVVVLGDWDCDGSQTPGRYEPATGRVYLFDGWASESRELLSRPARETGIRDGRPGVVSEGGCDDLVIEGGQQV